MVFIKGHLILAIASFYLINISKENTIKQYILFIIFVLGAFKLPIDRFWNIKY